MSIDPPKLFASVEINSGDMGSEPRKRNFYEIYFSEEMKRGMSLQEGTDFAFFNPSQLPAVAEIVPFDLGAVTLFVHSRLNQRQIIPLQT